MKIIKNLLMLLGTVTFVNVAFIGMDDSHQIQASKIPEVSWNLN